MSEGRLRSGKYRHLDLIADIDGIQSLNIHVAATHFHLNETISTFEVQSQNEHIEFQYVGSRGRVSQVLYLMWN